MRGSGLRRRQFLTGAAITTVSLGSAAASNEYDAAFQSCQRAEITGTFQDGDYVHANLVAFDVGGPVTYTGGECGIAIGDDVPAPLSGTIVFEVVEDGDYEVTETDYGAHVQWYAGVITGISSPDTVGPRSDYRNPDSTACVEAIRPDEFDVTILDTNDPVVAGESLTARVEVANTDEATISRTIYLVVGHSPTVEDSTVVSVAPGEREVLELGYETFAIDQDVTFPIVAEAGDEADQQQVMVFATDTDDYLDVTIARTTAPVASGEWLEVVVSVGNGATEEVTDTLTLYDSTGDALDSRDLTLPGEATETIALGYETYDTEQDVTFPLTVASSGDSDSVEVTVTADEPDGHLDVSISRTTAPVAGGEYLEIIVSVGNGETHEVSDTITLSDSSGSTLDSRDLTLPGEATETISLGYETHDTQQDVTFPLTVESSSDSESVEVTVTAADGDPDGHLDVDIAGTTAPVTGGERLDVTVELDNGTSRAITETVTLTDSSGNTVDQLDVTVDAAASETTTLGWTTHPVDEDVTFSITVAGEGDSATTEVIVYGTEADTGAEDETDAPETNDEETPDGGDQDASDAGDDGTDETGDDGAGDGEGDDQQAGGGEDGGDETDDVEGTESGDGADGTDGGGEADDESDANGQDGSDNGDETAADDEQDGGDEEGDQTEDGGDDQTQQDETESGTSNDEDAAESDE